MHDIRFVAGFLGGMLFAFILIIMLASQAQSHSWYDTDCCSGDDCRETKPGEVIRWYGKHHVTGQYVEGFQHVETGKVWYRGDRWLRPSKDGSDHICWPPTNKLPLCFYEGPSG